MEHFLKSLSNQELLARIDALVQRGRAVEAKLLTHLGEVDARRLYLEVACSSMFLYCVRVLHFSEAAAYKRIRAARAARRHPEILEALRRGDLHVTAVSLLAAQLTDANCGEWIQLAKHKTAEAIKRLLADRQPKPAMADCLRRMSAPTMSAPTKWALPATASVRSEAPPTVAEAASTRPEISTTVTVSTLVSAKAEIPVAVFGSVQTSVRTESPVSEKTVVSCGKQAILPNRVAGAFPGATSRERESSPVPPSRSEPLGGERYRVCFTADETTHAQIQELRALMRHQLPDGDLGKILGRAVALLLREVRKRKFGEVLAPRSETFAKEAYSRPIPAAIRRAVFHRDGGRCSYVSPQGRRCGTRDFLEFHHIVPWVRTQTHSVEGIALRCRAHNQYHACRDFGDKHMARFRKA